MVGEQASLSTPRYETQDPIEPSRRQPYHKVSLPKFRFNYLFLFFLQQRAQ